MTSHLMQATVRSPNNSLHLKLPTPLGSIRFTPDDTLVPWREDHDDKSAQNQSVPKKSACSPFNPEMAPKGSTATPRRSKPAFELNSPYAAPQWPEVGQQMQSALLKILSELVSPIGEWRSRVPVSKGKRSKKRKLADTEAAAQATTTTVSPPTIASYVTVGLNSTSRALEEQGKSSHGPAPLRAVFLTYPAASLQYSHLPILALSAKTPVQLVPLHAAAEKELCAALSLPRAGVIGLRSEAPGIEGLLALLDEVPPVQVPFLQQASSGQWLGMKANLSTAQIHNT